MTVHAIRHPAETALDWVASAALAAATSWAAWRLTASPAYAAAAGMAGLALGLLAMRRFGAGDRAEAFASFEPAAFDSADFEDDELLLDDPLVEAGPDARVVRLFERDVATPGEMVARIADFLGEDRSKVVPLPIREESASPPDARAALHAALANIRASLR